MTAWGCMEEYEEHGREVSIRAGVVNSRPGSLEGARGGDPDKGAPVPVEMGYRMAGGKRISCYIRSCKYNDDDVCGHDLPHIDWVVSSEFSCGERVAYPVCKRYKEEVQDDREG